MTTFIYKTLICPKHYGALEWGGCPAKIPLKKVCTPCVLFDYKSKIMGYNSRTKEPNHYIYYLYKIV